MRPSEPEPFSSKDACVLEGVAGQLAPPFGRHGDEARPALCLLLLGEGRPGLLLFHFKKCFR